MECTYSVGWTCHYFELLYFEYVICKRVRVCFAFGWLWQPPVFFKKVFVSGNLMWRFLNRLYSHLALEWRAQARSKFTQSEFLLFGLAEEFHGRLNYMVHGPSMPPTRYYQPWVGIHWHRYSSLLQVFIHLPAWVYEGTLVHLHKISSLP
jgi:hypothetical protein